MQFNTSELLKIKINKYRKSPYILHFVSSEFKKLVALSKDFKREDFPLFFDYLDSLESLVLGFDFKNGYEIQARNILDFYRNQPFPLSKKIIELFDSVFYSSKNSRKKCLNFLEGFLKSSKKGSEKDIAKNNVLHSYSLQGRIEKIEDLLSKIEEGSLRKNIDKLIKINDDYDKLEDELNSRTREFSRLVEDLKSFHSEAIEAQRIEYIDSIEDLKKAFEVDLSLKSAVKYWSDKARKHRKDAKNIISILTYFSPFALIVLAGIIFMIFLASNSLNGDLIDKNFKYVISAIFITVFVWGFRLAVKIWLSNHHLANDAEERVILVQTYLALMKDGGVPQDDDKKIVMNSIFRQAADGVVKDDGMPNPILNLVTKK